MKSSPTFPERVASIDIGTNTMLLLIARVRKGVVEPLLEKEAVVRLGEGLAERRVLSKAAMERGIETLGQYVRDCRAFDVQKIIAVGTSALREAENAHEFLKDVKERLGLSIEVITGEEEAKLSFMGVSRDLRGLKEPILVADIGGGSTEFIWGWDGQMIGWKSVPMGSVRYTEGFLRSDPVQEEEQRSLHQAITQWLRDLSLPRRPFRMVAVGGTATTLVSVELGLHEFDHQKIHHFILRKEALRRQLDLYRSKTIRQRKEIIGLPPARSDVIFAGATILYLTMERFHCDSALVSCHGLRYGLIYKTLES